MKIITFCIIASPKSFEAGISEKFICEPFDVLCTLTFQEDFYLVCEPTLTFWGTLCLQLAVS